MVVVWGCGGGCAVRCVWWLQDTVGGGGGGGGGGDGTVGFMREDEEYRSPSEDSGLGLGCADRSQR